MSETAARVLNVDDTEVARYTKSRLLRHAGFDVVEASNGTAALEIVERSRPSLVLLDMRLPDIDGGEVCKIIKRRWPETMVLQTSATYVSSGDRTRGLDGGADAYLAQPIDGDELVAAIRALLRLHAAEAATRAVNDSLEERIQQRTAELREANVKLVQQMAQRERAEAALIHSQKLEAIGQLTSAIAHDFNNLLAGISGYLQIIERLVPNGAPNNMARQGLQLIHRGSKLTGRLLNLARTRAARLEPVDVEALLDGMRDWLQQSIGSGCELQVTSSGRDLIAISDAAQLEFAVLNLVMNARDAMPGGGPIRVAVERRRPTPDDAELAALADVDHIVITVTDRGHGMTPEVMTQAFNPFYSTKAAGQGTGLGLAQVRDLAEQSKGAAQVTSTLGEGSSVLIWLPAGEAAMLGAPYAAPATGVAADKSVRVMLIDDEPDVLLTLGALLSSAGCEVMTFASAREALAHLESNAVDVLITDLSMPELPGIEVAHRARAIHPSLPVIFISGRVDVDEVEVLALKAQLVRKPFAPSALMQALSKAVAVG